MNKTVIIESGGATRDYDSQHTPSSHTLEHMLSGSVEIVKGSFMYQGVPAQILVNNESHILHLPLNKTASQLFGVALLGTVVILTGSAQITAKAATE